MHCVRLGIQPSSTPPLLETLNELEQSALTGASTSSRAAAAALSNNRLETARFITRSPSRRKRRLLSKLTTRNHLRRLFPSSRTSTAHCLCGCPSTSLCEADLALPTFVVPLYSFIHYCNIFRLQPRRSLRTLPASLCCCHFVFRFPRGPLVHLPFSAIVVAHMAH